MAFVHPTDPFGREPLGENGLDPERALDALRFDERQILPPALPCPDRGVRVGSHAPSGAGQHRSVLEPLEQDLTGLLLQRADAGAHGRLAYVESLRRTVKAAGARDVEEGLQVLDIQGAWALY